jgi:tetratricopeptide (TPR) repeat protein
LVTHRRCKTFHDWYLNTRNEELNWTWREYVDTKWFSMRQVLLPDILGLRKHREQHRQEQLQVEKAFKQRVTKADLYSNRGLRKYRRKQYIEALEDYQEAVRLSEDTEHNLSILYFNIGQVYFVLSDLKLALDYFTKAIEVEQESPILANM